MKDIIFDQFQNSVNDSLLRHRSILDLITKYSESNSRVNRAIAKSVTNCGCIKINASKQNITQEDSLENISDHLNTHITGELCDNCREIIEGEIGNNIFYLTALCNDLGINLYDILLKETEKINTLGKFTFR
ncbi:MAG: DUF1573 domain-containing protein [Clostridium sp.]|jgi:hypothetical protein|nr:DUF1573 domain-containing protein [Clostridium sp.]